MGKGQEAGNEEAEVGETREEVAGVLRLQEGLGKGPDEANVISKGQR